MARAVCCARVWLKKKGIQETMQENDSGTRSETTLFLLASADGKITSGQSDALDADWDWKRIHGVKEGLNQYYQIEQTTDLFSLITGRIVAKLRPDDPAIPAKDPDHPPLLNSIIVDSKPWTTRHDLKRTAQVLKHLYLVTSNSAHPALDMQGSLDNLTVLHYPDAIDFENLFCKMKQEYGADRITIQSGGTLNAVLLRAGLVDHILLVVAPLLVGGKATPSIIDGRSFQAEEDLLDIRALRLAKCEPLQSSYVRLEYDVIQDTVVDSK